MSTDWRYHNQRHLAAALAEVRGLLLRHAERGEGELQEAPPAARPAGKLPPAPPGLEPPALEAISELFDLSPFARSLLVLCAGMELDATVAPLCARAQGDPQRAFPTFSLALAALPGAAWDEIVPAAPLRRWRLIEVLAGPTLTASPLRIDERILHALAGIDQLDQRLAELVEPVPPPQEIVPSHRTLAEQLATAWSRTAGSADFPVVQLSGPDPASRRAVAAAACAFLELDLHALPAEALPASHRETEDLVRLWEREAALGAGALLVECEDLSGADTAREAALSRLVQTLGSPLILSGRERRRARQRPLLTLDVAKPSPAEQRALWQSALGPGLDGRAAALDEGIAALTAQFDLAAPTLRAAYAGALGSLGPDEEPATAPGFLQALWDTCRVQARPRLDDLAQRIEPAAGWEDLILPEAQLAVLREIALQVRHRARVYESWGFAGRSSRGLGVAALFSGASGTGKTLAAEVLARDLGLDLYRIDLALVVSKYIGETEKNLQKVFDAAEEGGAILLFDEADALFGKRSEVKDSHDRHANIEVSYLLQRMEAYRGLAILTTNLKDALDPAFLRRLRFIVQFAFPDAHQRAEIWRRAFPAATPTEGIDAEKLARLNVAGGNIRNIALSAAFLAAAEEEPVRMAHLLKAARAEYAKIEKPLTESEIRGWI